MPSIVAIIGRANVGKSRLFNRITGTRKAIVDDRPGVTRDRHYSVASWRDKEFIVVDTGGIDLEPDSDLEHKVTSQSIKAISEADIIICVFDGRVEPTSYDHEIVKKLRKVERPVLFAVNKVDSDNAELLSPYYRLGIEPVAISAEHGRGVDDLLEELYKHLPASPKGLDKKDIDIPKFAIIGRPNVGKSTLLNRLVGEERSVVHEKPGTTMDTIDVAVTVGDKECYLVDTAGIRRKRAEHVEWIASLKTIRAMSSSHAVCLVIDANEGLVHQDKELASLVMDEGRAMCIAVNKWDLVNADTKEASIDIKEAMGKMANVPVLFLSALKGSGCQKVLPTLLVLHKRWSHRLSTSEINDTLRQAVNDHHPKCYQGKDVKLYYATQVATAPPRLVIFANYPEAIDRSYRQFLTKRFLEKFGSGITIRLDIKKRTR